MTDNEELKDSVGRLLGRIKVRGDGHLELRNEQGKLLGTYDPGNNITKNEYGNMVGRGNILTMLLTN